MNPDRLVISLEKDIANLLLTKLEHEEMTLERASLIAKFVLAHLPETLTNEQLKQVLPLLDDEFIELAGLVHLYMNKYEEKTKKKITQDVQTLIHSGHFNEVSAIMKEYFRKRLP